MKSTDLVDAMNALNVVRSRRKSIKQIDHVMESDNPAKTNFRITNDNGDSFSVGNGKQFLEMIRDAFVAEIEANLEVLEMIGIEIEPDEDEDEDSDEE